MGDFPKIKRSYSDHNDAYRELKHGIAAPRFKKAIGKSKDVADAFKGISVRKERLAKAASLTAKGAKGALRHNLGLRALQGVAGAISVGNVAYGGYQIGKHYHGMAKQRRANRLM